MPNCKNDVKTKYIGTEPSPKGLGYCAHAEKINTIKKGKDGNNWIIVETKNNIKRWNKINGSIKKDKNGNVWKSVKKPNGLITWRLIIKRQASVDEKQTSIQIKKTSKIKKYGKKYYVHDNGGRPFEVVINSKNVSVYVQTNTKDYDEKEIYDKLFKTFTDVKNIYIGKDSKNNSFKGNSILIDSGVNNKFICITNCVFEFELGPDDEVVKYFSQVGNSDVPYPVLLGKKYFYSMIEKTYCKRELFPTSYKTSDFEDAHTFYYGNFVKNKGWVSEIKDKKKLPKLKILHKRLW